MIWIHGQEIKSHDLIQTVNWVNMYQRIIIFISVIYKILLYISFICYFIVLQKNIKFMKIFDMLLAIPQFIKYKSILNCYCIVKITIAKNKDKCNYYYIKLWKKKWLRQPM